MKRMASVAVVVVSLLLPAGAFAQAAQDRASGHGGVVDRTDPFGTGFTFDFDAASEPDGSGPAGSALLVFEAFHFSHWQGPVTCLAVDGNRAVIGFAVESQDPFPRPQRAGMLMSVVDGGTVDTFAATSTEEAGLGNIIPTNCRVVLTTQPQTLTEGNIAVTDAQPFPTSKDQCKDGAWRNYGTVFKNQGQCVSFVATGGKNQPAS